MATSGARRGAGRLSGNDPNGPLVQQAIDRSADRATAADEVHALVAATFDVIATTGSVEPQVRDILERADLSRQVFYRHFDSKDQLLLVVLDEMMRMTATYLEKRITRADGPVQALRAWIDGVLRQAQDPESSRRTRPFVMMGHRLRAQFPGEYANGQELILAPLGQVIATGVHDGVFASDRPADDALIIHDAVFMRQNRCLVLGTPPTRKLVDDLHGFALRALRP